MAAFLLLLRAQLFAAISRQKSSEVLDPLKHIFFSDTSLSSPTKLTLTDIWVQIQSILTCRIMFQILSFGGGQTVGITRPKLLVRLNSVALLRCIISQSFGKHRPKAHVGSSPGWRCSGNYLQQMIILNVEAGLTSKYVPIVLMNWIPGAGAASQQQLRGLSFFLSF